MMKVEVFRKPSRNETTIGHLVLYHEGRVVFRCQTLEDQIREVLGRPVAEWKKAGMTAIPQGNYTLEAKASTRLQGKLVPWVLGVPGFEAIQIHPGNTIADTAGCILPGMQGGPFGTTVENSKMAFDIIMYYLTGQPEGKAIISIYNPIDNQPAGD